MSDIVFFFSHKDTHSDRVSADGPEVTLGLETCGWGGVRLVESTKTCRWLSGSDIPPRDRKGSKGRSPGPIRGIGPLEPNCRACGEGSICLTSVGRGSSLIVGPMSCSGICLVFSSPLGVTVVAARTGGGSWRISGLGASGAEALVLRGKEVPECSVPAGLFGVDSCFSLPVPDLRGGGYASPRASATALRLSVSALLGRPRFRGGSPLTRFSNEDRCVEAPLSLPKEVALVGGRG